MHPWQQHSVGTYPAHIWSKCCCVGSKLCNSSEGDERVWSWPYVLQNVLQINKCELKCQLKSSLHNNSFPYLCNKNITTEDFMDNRKIFPPCACRNNVYARLNNNNKKKNLSSFTSDFIHSQKSPSNQLLFFLLMPRLIFHILYIWWHSDIFKCPNTL